MIERLLPIAATIVARSLRVRHTGVSIPKKAVVMFWHGKMFAGWYAARHHTPVALVSPSRDGNLLTKVLGKWGYQVERGSSSKSGMEALERAMKLVRSGRCQRVVITPDGPRGPRHRMKRGGALAAKELGLPLYFCKIEYRRARMLEKSWDKFEVPLPFSRVDVHTTSIDLKDYPEALADQHTWLNQLVTDRGLG